MSSSGCKCLSLKILLLRFVHIDQNNQGDKDPSPKPIGGRQVSSLDASNHVLKSDMRFRFSEDVHGKDSQTFLAKSHVKKRWVIDSSSASQWIHFALSKIVRLLRFSPTGRAFCIAFHRSSFILGEHLVFHNFVFHS
ncbi:unnamed protein product [Arabidopsis lyrata]|nr:unnamed protein product [Arabidopsis lyrata]